MKGKSMEQSFDLASIHPVFKLQSTQALWMGKVKKLNTHGNFQSRFLVVTNFGLFLLEQKAFPRSLLVSRFLPYLNITLIELKSSQVTFHCNGSTALTLKSNEYIIFTNVIYTILKFLMKEQLEVKLQITDVLNEFEGCNFNYKTESIRVDRFMLHVLSNHQLSHLQNLENIIEITEKLQNPINEFTFTSETASSNFISSIIFCLVNDPNINHIILKNLNLCSFSEKVFGLAQNNPAINKISFENIKFSANQEALQKIINSGFGSNVTDFCLKECELINPEFLVFLQSLNSQNLHIFSLSFTKCRFSPINIKGILNALNEYSTFQSLKRLYFYSASCSEPLDDIFTNFIKTAASNSITKLFLINCGINLSSFLPSVMSSEPSYTKLNLSRNDFSKPLTQPISSFYVLENLILSLCEFTAESFSSLIKSLSLAQFSPSRISLDCIRFDVNNTSAIYDCLSNSRLSTVCNLSWANNQMKPTEVQKFCRFLANNPNIADIDISNSISMVNVDESMKILANYIKSSSIGSLIIRGTSPTVYGRHLYPVLDELSNVSTLKHLDVTGQNILDRGLGYLYNLIIHGLEELYFDGSGSSFESLNQFITEMMQTDITQTQWPESDVKNIISNSNPSQIKEIENDLNKLKTSFSKQYSSTTTDSFGSQASNNTPSTAMPRRRHRLTYKRRRKGTLKKSMPLLPVTRRSILVKMQCEADFAYREEPIASYFYECLGVDAVTEMRTDVLLNTFYKIYG